MKKEIIKKNKEDLIKEINEKFISLREIRFDTAGSKNKNVKQQKNIKKEIARLRTVLNGMN